MKNYKNDAPPILREFLIYMETIKGKSEKTVFEYYLDLRMFFRYLTKEKCHLSNDIPFDEIDVSPVNIDIIKAVTLLDLYEFLHYLHTERKLSARSRARKIASLRSFFKYLNTKAKLIDDDPAKHLDSPKLKKSLPIHLSLKESIELLESVEGPNKERDYAILTLFLNCGMRLSELCNINISDLKSDTVVITGKGNKERTVYLNDACLSAIKAYLEVRPRDGVIDRDALFLSRLGKRISVKTVQWLTRKYIKSSGLNESKYSVHKLRHTAATLMYQHGDVDIRTLQEILGHEQLSTTEIYTHIDDNKLRKAVSSNPLSKLKSKKE